MSDPLTITTANTLVDEIPFAIFVAVMSPDDVIDPVEALNTPANTLALIVEELRINDPVEAL